MGLCIAVKEENFREALDILGTDKFKYKFLFDTSNHDEFHEDMGINKLNDNLIFSGCASYFRNSRGKFKGSEARIHWGQMINQLFLEERHLSIVNDFYDNPYMVLVFSDKYIDKAATKGKVTMTFTRDEMDDMIDVFLNQLEMQEGMSVATFELYKSGIIKDVDKDNEGFKRRQASLKERNIRTYKHQLIRHFEDSFKFRLITYYTKLREYNLDEIMRKLDDLGFLDEKFRKDNLYIYEEEARRILAKRLCTISFKNDIEVLIKQGIIDRDKIQYNIGLNL